MKITYDNEIDAMYIYFPPTGPPAVGRTESHQELKVELDANNQIIALQLSETSEFQFGHRLKYALQAPGAAYDEEGSTLRVEFAPGIIAKRAVQWSANIDMNQEGRLVGIEVLFGERLTGHDKLTYISPHLISFDDPYFEVNVGDAQSS
jgi:uncharacterized protein YuzE